MEFQCAAVGLAVEEDDGKSAAGGAVAGQRQRQVDSPLAAAGEKGPPHARQRRIGVAAEGEPQTFPRVLVANGIDVAVPRLRLDDEHYGRRGTVIQHGIGAHQDLLAGEDHHGPIAHRGLPLHEQRGLPRRGNEIELAFRAIAPGGHHAVEPRIGRAAPLGILDAAVGAEPKPEILAVGVRLAARKQYGCRPGASRRRQGDQQGQFREWRLPGHVIHKIINAAIDSLSVERCLAAK